jgi:hypothetical protein
MTLTTQQSFQVFHRSSAIVTIQILHTSHPTGSGAAMQARVVVLAEQEKTKVGFFQ